MNNVLLFAVALVWVATAATPAHAYLDPGTGSMILQVLLGGIAGALVVVKLYWKKIKRFFLRTPAGEAGTENEHADR